MSSDTIIDQAVQMAIAAKENTPLQIGKTVASTQHKKSMVYLGEVNGMAMGEYPGSGILKFPAETVFDVNLCQNLAFQIRAENKARLN